MMRMCLVSPLSVSDFVDPELTLGTYRRKMAPQLGILCLAAELLETGIDVEIVNLDECFFDFVESEQQKAGLRTDGASRPCRAAASTCGESSSAAGLSGFASPDAFFADLVRRFEATEFDAYGFGSICSSYPLTLRLAEEVKRLRPAAPIIVGGPQASVVDRQTVRTFPFVDYVVRGEADITLPRLMAALAGTGAPTGVDDIPGITFRRGTEVIRNAAAPVIDDLDALPLPAFHLDPRIRERNGAHLEIGRGCPFTCTFCSTNDFFRRNFRLKSPARMLEQMREVKARYGIRNFSLVHDMYTINRKEVVAFCEALLDSGEDFIWSCSARTDCIDNDLIALMGRSGCRGIFFGIETGSARMQKIINKKLDLAEATERIRCADENGITTAVALITSFPDETRDDLRDTIHYFVRSLRFDNAEPQISLLAPLAETPLSTQHQDRLIFDNIFSDMSYQGWRQDPKDVELITAYPDIFTNFYAIPTEYIERQYFRDVHDFVTAIACWFRWLPVALVEDSGDFLAVFDRWQEWRAQNVLPDEGRESGAAPYYNRNDFPIDFSNFVQNCYLKEMAAARKAVGAVNEVERLPGKRKEPPPPEGLEEPNTLTMESLPYRAPDVRQIELDMDYREIVTNLRLARPLEGIHERNVSVVFVTPEPGKIEVRQLGALAADLLRLCDGKTTVGEMVNAMSRSESRLREIPADKVCLFSLSCLYEWGLIRLSPAAPVELAMPELSLAS